MAGDHNKYGENNRALAAKSSFGRRRSIVDLRACNKARERKACREKEKNLAKERKGDTLKTRARGVEKRASAVPECIIRALIYSSNYSADRNKRAAQFQRESACAHKSTEIGS